MHQTLTHIAQIGKIVVGRRRALGLSQQALAAKLGISQSYLSQIETNVGTLSAQRLLDIANILDLELVIQTKQDSQKTEW